MGGRENIKYLGIFILVVVLAAVISISYKVFLAAKNSTFKYGTYNLLIEERDVYLVRINQAQKKLLIVKFPKTDEFSKSKTRLSKALTLGTVIDGRVVAEDIALGITPDFLNAKTMLNIFTNPSKIHFDNLNEIDFIKMFYYTKQISRTDRDFLEIKRIEEFSEIFDKTYHDFLDQKIFNEKKDVQIINATEIDGLGARFSKLLAGLGYNVISIETEDARPSNISFEKSSVSIRRLWDFLKVPFKEKTSSIADITVVLGGDLVEELTP